MALAPSVEFPASTACADPLQDNQYLAGLLAETTGRPLDEVQGRLRRERRLLGSNVGDALRRANLEPHVWNDGLIAFYGATDAFLYETVVWNQMAEKEAMRQWIIEFLHREQRGPQRILAYGDGPGIDSLRLAQAGHQVTYFEVGDRNLRLRGACLPTPRPRWKSSPRRLRGKPRHTTRSFASTSWNMFRSPSKPSRGSAAFSVPAAVCSSMLRSGCSTGRCVTHLRSNLTFSGDWRRLYASNGLVPPQRAALLEPHRPGEARRGDGA